MTSSASRSCGTAFGCTKDVTSIRGRPAADSRSTTSTFCAVGMKSGSIWNPSRVPTSHIVTRVGSFMTSSGSQNLSGTLARRTGEPVGRPPTSQDREDTMSPNIGISDNERKKIVTILNTLLADEYMLYTKTRNYHWNVVGPQFNDLQ